MIDPLKDTGLIESEIRNYRYLLALQEISEGRSIENTLSVDAIRAYLKNEKAAYCKCGRWFLDSIDECLALADEYAVRNTDHHELFTAGDQEFASQVEEWEHFRSRYSQTATKQTLTRTLTIRLFYFSRNLVEG